MVTSPLVTFTSDGDDVVDFDFVEELEAVFAPVEADAVARPLSGR